MKRRTRAAAILAGAFIAAAGPARAQTDYYNTDEGRPVRIEDALPVERHAFELQIAPLRVERSAGDHYDWEVEPELAWGVLPRTQVELSLPLRFHDTPGAAFGLEGIIVSALHNLNTETSIPAMALAGGVRLPVGGLAGDRVYGTLKGIATRTMGFGRVHANGEVTFGAADEDPDGAELSRWMAGVAVDRAFPLRSLLLMADVFAEQPITRDAALAWTAEAGLRYQTSPQVNVDFGLGRRFAGEEPAWFFTVGVAHAFALRSLLSGGAE